MIPWLCRRPVRLLLSGALSAPALLALFLVVQSREPAASANAHGMHRLVATTTVASPAQPSTMPRPVTAPVAVDTVLPELQQPVTDWREFAPAQIAVAPLPGRPLAFVAATIVRQADSTIWTGHSEIAGATLVGVGTREGWDAILTLPGASEFEIHIRRDRAVVVEKNPGSDACSQDGAVALQADVLGLGAIAPNSPSTIAADTAVATVDVLFFYDADCRAAATARALDGNGAALIDSLLLARIALCNTALARSGVTNLQWRSLGGRIVPTYPRTGRLADDLAILTGVATDAGRFMAAQAAALGADQTVLLVGGAADFAGLALVPGHQAVVSWEAGYETTAHELAHNFGCQHDRQSDNAPAGNGLYGYGCRFDYAGRDCGDLMSYAGYRLPLFSNPALLVDPSAYILGLPAGSVAFGVAAEQPQAADAARLLRDRATSMADYRSSVVATPPAIVTSPTATTVGNGTPVTLSVTATGGALSYQWRRNGTALAGATSPTLTIAVAALSDAGHYDCIVTNSLGTATTATAAIAVGPVTGGAIAAPLGIGTLVNLSARALVRPGADLLIGGLAIEGGKAQILLRASGPALAGFGVAAVLADPVLKAFDSAGNLIAQNDNWSDGSDGPGLATVSARLGAFAFANGSKDAALRLTLDSGCYTFQVAGVSPSGSGLAGASTGVALLEIYLLEDSGLPGRLVNLSARSFAGTDSEVLIAGFVARGDGQVLVRGVGPSLADYGVSGVLKSLRLEVYDGSILVDRPQDWSATYSVAQAAALFRKVGAFPLAAHSHDSIALMDFTGGAVRTVQVKGDNGGTGVALAEVYLVRP